MSEAVVQINLPRLRFPEFSGPWEKRILSKDLIESKLGGNYSNSTIPTSWPLIKMGNLGRGIMNVARIDFIEEGEEIDPDDRIKYGDLFFNTRNTLDLVGKVSIWRGELPKAYFNSNLLRITFACNEFMNLRFNSYSGVKSLKRIAAGTTSVAAIYTKDFLKVRIIVPTLPEQQKIADFLGAVDARVGLLRRRRGALRAYRKGMMRRLFLQELRFTKADGSPFPDWQEKRLGEVARKTSSSLAANMLPDFSGQYPIFGANGFLGNLRTYENEEPYIAIVKDGAGVGRVFMCPEKSSVLGTLDQIHRRDANDIKFIYYFLAHFDFLKYVAGSTIPHIYFRDYGQAKLCVPHPEEQQKIADTLTAFDAKIDAVTAQMDAMLRFKKGLLQQMFV